MVNVQDMTKTLNLEVLYSSTVEELPIETSDLNRPGLQFSNYFDYFAHDRVQVLGKVEMTYLSSLPEDIRKERIEKYFSYNLSCVIICRNMPCPDDILEQARLTNTHLFRSRVVTTKFMQDCSNYISSELAARTTRHGVLVEVFGVGVLITGESAVGKSETALELIMRGHKLIADDCVDIKQVSEDRLIGSAPEILKYFMEIRGIGIINIKEMYGVGSIAINKSIDLVCHLELWDNTKEYDRLGLTEEYINILGVKVQKLVVPVRPGRNLSIIIEVAARNKRLKSMGYSAAHDLHKRLKEKFDADSALVE